MNTQDIEKLCKRAKRKYINTPVLTHLIELNSPLKSRYITSLACSSLIIQSDSKIHSKYCKRMWCTVCAPIRTAIRLNNYSPLLMALEDLHLTTLTVPNVPYFEIKKSVQHFRKVFRQFRDTYKKRTGIDFKGVYNFEVTINTKTNLFHPHIHIIHEDGAHGEALINYWLDNEKKAKRIAQDSRPCTDLIEGFKYQSKSVFYVKKNNERQYIIPAKQLDQLYQQLQGVRCFNAFGIKIIKEDQEDKQMDELTAYETDKPDGSYLWEKIDWYMEQMVEKDTGELLNYYADNTTIILTELSGFKPKKNQEKIYEQLAKNEHYKTGTEACIS